MADNVFDQFDVHSGTLPQPAGGNVFDQFEGGQPPPPPVEKPPPPPPKQPPSLYQSVYENPMLGAEQRAVPHPERYGPPLASGKDVSVSDAGEISFKDAQGNDVPTDRRQHVILQGPEGLSVYARTPQTRESPVEGMARVLTMGLGAPAPGAPTLAAEASIPRLKAAATGVYESPAIADQPFDQAALGAAFREIAPSLARTDPRSIQRIQGELNDLGGTVNDLNLASERLGKIAAETQGPVGNQTATGDAAAAQIVKKRIDQFIRESAPEMTDADKNYAAYKATQTIVNRGNLANVMSRGGDLLGRLQTQATQLLKDPRAMRAFTPEETAMIEALQRGELRGEGLRNAAQLVSGKLGQALSLGGGLVGMKHGGLLEGVAGYVGGSVVEPVLSRFLQSWGNQLGADAVDRLTRAIRARSPLGQELAQKVSTYNDAQSALFRQPTTTTLGTLAHTSRELSLSLRRLGVDIRPPQLMGGTKADEDKDQVPRPPSQ